MRASTPSRVPRWVGGAALATSVMSAALVSCSVVLDWSGYTGGTIADGGPDGAGDDALPPCNPTTCGGCCDLRGFCAGGQSADTCGSRANTCQDCTAQSQVCNAGSCQAPPHDAGDAGDAGDADDAAPCNPVTCTQVSSCLMSLQIGCCKADLTCGCVYIPGLGPPGCN